MHAATHSADNGRGNGAQALTEIVGEALAGASHPAGKKFREKRPATAKNTRDKNPNGNPENDLVVLLMGISVWSAALRRAYDRLMKVFLSAFA
jgi:hypothetical protein